MDFVCKTKNKTDSADEIKIKFQKKFGTGFRHNSHLLQWVWKWAELLSYLHQQMQGSPWSVRKEHVECNVVKLQLTFQMDGLRRDKNTFQHQAEDIEYRADLFRTKEKNEIA